MCVGWGWGIRTPFFVTGSMRVGRGFVFRVRFSKPPTDDASRVQLPSWTRPRHTLPALSGLPYYFCPSRRRRPSVDDRPSLVRLCLCGSSTAPISRRPHLSGTNDIFRSIPLKTSRPAPRAIGARATRTRRESPVFLPPPPTRGHTTAFRSSRQNGPRVTATSVGPPPIRRYRRTTATRTARPARQQSRALGAQRRLAPLPAHPPSQ